MTKNKDTHWYNRPWTISIGSTLLGVLASIVYDLIKEKPILSTVVNLVTSFFDFLGEILTYDIKVWWILVFLILLILAVFLIAYFPKKAAPQDPPFLKYTTDNFTNWKWSWTWRFLKLEGKWAVDNLIPHCPKCDTHMLDQSSSFSTHFKCPRCGYYSHYRNYDDSHEIEAVIYDNIRKGIN